MHVTFRLGLPGLARAVFLVERHRLDASGDAETGFLDGVRDLARHDAALPFPALALRALECGEVDWLVAIRNPDLVLDEGLPARIAAAIARAEAMPAGISLMAAGGLGPNGARLSALYSSTTPFIPHQSQPSPLFDPLPDLMILDAGFLAALTAAHGLLPEAAFEAVLVAEGYLAGRIALYAPDLAAGVNDGFRARDLGRLRGELTDWFGDRLPGQVVPTLMGEVRIEAEGRPPERGTRRRPPVGREDLSRAIETTVDALSTPLSLSIVTRTRFARPWLLERLLTSITRARLPEMSLEVILATDCPAERAEREIAALQSRFVGLDLRLAVSTDQPGHSRVANLLAGFRAARLPHVAVMDDDDYVDLFAFAAMQRCLFLGARPLMVTGSRLHHEEWQETPSGRHVLTRSVEGEAYPAAGWRQMFGGVNKLPVCALVMPRERLLARLDCLDLAHDLSEDYALYLLVLTDPQLPAIVEVPGVFGHISVRKRGDNSVTMADRRPWVRDIALFLHDLTREPGVCGPGVWALLAAAGGADLALRDRTIAEQQAGVRERDRQIRLMRRDIARLRAAAGASLEGNR